MTITSRQLDDVIVTSYLDATAFHGDLGLPAGTWKQHVIAILKKCQRNPEDAAAAAFAQRLHTRDLYLATCCAERLDCAWERFETLYQKYIRELVRCLARNGLQALDVGDGLLVDLFLPDRSGQSRIASYDGRSSLATWLHVIVTHRLANERVRKWNTVERPGDMPEVADTSSERELDVALRAARYGPAIDESLRKASQGLSERERQLLIWRYQGGLLLEDIARLLSVHPSTVFRQIGRLQERLRNDVIATLAGTYGFVESVIDECLCDILEDRLGSVSLLRLISEPLPQDWDGVQAPVQSRQIA